MRLGTSDELSCAVETILRSRQAARMAAPAWISTRGILKQTDNSNGDFSG